MADISIAILGMGRVGASVGLSLKRYNARPDAKHRFKITAFDTISDNLKAAQKLNAADDYVRQAFDAVRGRDIVILAMPYAEVEATYKYIASDLRPGVVLIDFSPLKQPSLDWAARYLPKEAHVLGATPLVNMQYLFDGLDKTELASADLFDDGLVLLMPSVTCIPAAIELGADFAAILGASSQFIDPAENDSLVAGTEGMPMLLGTSFFLAMMRSQGWGDSQRVTNPTFGMLTRHLFDTHPDDLRDLWMNNADSMVRWIDDYTETLAQFRAALATRDRDALESAIGLAAQEYERWYNRRAKNRWGQEALKQNDPSPDVMQSFFGGFISNRLRRKGDNGDKE